jgi:hypothetical protein
VKVQVLDSSSGIEQIFFKSNIEILVFRARREATGYAVDKCFGVMEYWNVQDPPLAVGIVGS